MLAGDALCAWAFELFAASPVSPQSKIKAIRLISHASGPEGMAGGQMLDLEKSAKIERLARLKTAELIAASICVGAVIAGAPKQLLVKLYRLGLMFGVLFQLTDDILDFEQDSIENKEKKGFLLRRASLFSTQAAKGFSSLGPDFSFFVQLCDVILNRKD
ncbi:MAG: polyprenyl synthetase family protein [bacterium]